MDKYEIGRSIGHGYAYFYLVLLAKSFSANTSSRTSFMWSRSLECLMMIARAISDKEFKTN